MSNLSEVSVAILAGGLGTRLSSVLSGQQKVVVKVREHPFLEYILNQLSKAGFKKIVMCTRHLGNQVKEAFGNNYKFLTIFYSQEPSLLDTAGAVRLALPYLPSEDILVTNGDSFLDIDLKKFWEFHIEKKANGTIALTKVSDTSRYGSVELDKNKRIVGFEEKKRNKRSGFINAGIYLFKRSILLEIPENKAVSFENEMFPSWIGKKFYGFKATGDFKDIGTSDDYNQAEEFFSKHPI